MFVAGKMRAIAHIVYSHCTMAKVGSPSGSDPRKRPVQRRSTETVASILEAAARILEVDGLGGYTTNAIAERAGVSIGSLYQYFPNKDAITRALIAREMNLLLDDIEPDDDPPLGQAGLARLVESAVRNQLRRPVLARLLDIEEARLPADNEVEGLASRMAHVLAKCLVSGDLRGRTWSCETTYDVVAIIKGLVDDAGRRGELDVRSLGMRVRRAVFGYLELPQSTAG
jgi:AcrR family transcriptional regulator